MLVDDDDSGPTVRARESCRVCGVTLNRTADFVMWSGLPQPIARALLQAPSLSPRERSVFELLGLGYDNRSLARSLEMSERTVKRHVTAILAKLGLESRLQVGLTAVLVLAATWPETQLPAEPAVAPSTMPAGPRLAEAMKA